MAFPSTLTSALSNNFISDTFRTTAYPKVTLMALMAGQTLMGNMTDTMIGRPGVQAVLAGGDISDAKRKSMRNMQAYTWGIQAFTPNNATNSAVYGSMPTNATATTTANSQIRANVNMPWSIVKRTVIYVWHADLDYAISNGGSVEGIGVNMTAVQENAVRSGVQDLITFVAPEFWSGNPSTWNTNAIDQYPGIATICGTGTYAQSSRVTGSALVSHTINATTGSGADDSNAINNNPVDICNSVNGGGANIIKYDDPIDTVITDYANYIKWKNNIMARGQIVQVVDNLPQMAKLGFKRDALQVDGRTSLTWDPSAPANVAACLSMRYFLFITHPTYNFVNTPLVNWKTQAEGAKDAYGAYVELKAIFVCEKPSAQAYLTNLP